MYTIYSNDLCIYDDGSDLDAYQLIKPVWHMEDNTSGTLSFTMPLDNIGYHTVERLKSRIFIYKNNVEVWEGRILSETLNFNREREIVCEGTLGFLNDVMQPQRELINPTVRSFLETIINYHNSKVDASKRFTLGTVTVTHPMINEGEEDEYDDDVYVYTNYESTFECITSKLIDKNTDKYNDKKKDLKGHLRVRKENGVRYLDYLADYPTTSSQSIDFGVNLLDFALEYDDTEYCTVLIPLGERYSEGEIDGLEGYLDITDVNGGKNYIVNQNAVNNFGWIEKVQHFDDITDDVELFNAAQTYLSDIQFDNMALSVTAVDLSNFDVNVSEIQLLDNVRVTSEQHGLDRLFPVTEIEVELDNPGQTKFTLGLKDIFTNNTVTYYANYMETTINENQQTNETNINAVGEELTEYKNETTATLENLGDSILAEIERATGEEGKLTSRILVTADQISAEVSRATDEEETLRSRITMTDSEIRSEVASINSTLGTMQSSIVQTSQQIAMKVDNGSVSSQLSVESDQITLQSGRLVIESGNFTLDANGYAKGTGFTADQYLRLTDSHYQWWDPIYIWQDVNLVGLSYYPNSSADANAGLMCGGLSIWKCGNTSQNPIDGELMMGQDTKLLLENGAELWYTDAPTTTKSTNCRIGTGDGRVGKVWRVTSGSSRRWKHDISYELTEEMDPERLYDLKVCQFKYNTDYLDNPLDQRYNTPIIGFIAEEVDEVYPQACEHDDYGRPTEWNEHYIIPPMLKLIQDQNKKIKELEERISILEGGQNNVSE